MIIKTLCSNVTLTSQAVLAHLSLVYLKQESAVKVKTVNCINPGSVDDAEFNSLFTELNSLGQTAHRFKGCSTTQEVKEN